MCGRYFYDLDSQELEELCREIQERHKQEERLAQQIASGEVYPSNYIVTLAGNREKEIVPGLTRWGFTGFRKNQLMINARSETVEKKKTFQGPFKNNRCVFPASGFYEWDQDKQKFYFSTDQTLYLAGFYRIHQSDGGAETESIILTTKPNSSVELVHDRMPVIIQREDLKNWITDLEFARELIQTEMPLLNLELVS